MLHRFPKKHFELLAEKGLLGAVINKKYGGSEYSMVLLIPLFIEDFRVFSMNNLFLY